MEVKTIKKIHFYSDLQDMETSKMAYTNNTVAIKRLQDTVALIKKVYSSNDECIMIKKLVFCD